MANELSLHFERIASTRAAVLWRMHTDPSELARWWGPHGFTNLVDSDLRVGGSYRITMTPPDGDAFHLRGEFRDIVTNELLAYTFAWEEPDTEDVPNEVKIAFEVQGDSTLMTIDHGPFRTEARRELHRSGWTESLDELERFLVSEHD